MPTKMEMDSAHTIEAQGSGRWDFLKRVCTLAEQIAMICCQCMPMPGCREVRFSGCATNCHDCTRAQGGPQCTGQVSVMQVLVTSQYSLLKKIGWFILNTI